ncbi:GMC family oxidoreductase [Caballeronia zhejiangensis]|uniref:GMC family oxidoreductase n=1 Tax=Caballeronia zhejiangensis TaxID=871203 RepID=UPI001EF59424|nr:GMC family oxidoreductase N-terminal domain-containing protein [Caballeronia zhejiangensis]MCG7400329.1 GMC family oxidoreductase N-terminal domain-containing protein [Caballeronia zhejiangensis]
METYDYIIVGAGSAGCALARRLSDDPGVTVLLLEAGPPAKGFWLSTPAGMARLFRNDRVNWSYFTEPVPTMANRKIYWPRGKVLGGSSSINGMVYIRGHRLDFDHWKSLGNAGWGYDEVLPYFRRMEHNARGGNAYRGAGGPVWISDPVVRHPSSKDFVEAAHRVGIPLTDDVNGELHDGVGFLQYNIRRGIRQSAYVAYIAPVRDRRNLVIKSDARVRRVLFEQRQTKGVEVVVDGQRRTFMAAREVVLSSGALNSPHLLMLSGIGDGATLQRFGIETLVDAPGVGRNLQDHFYVHCLVRSTAESSFNRDLHGLRKYWQGLRYVVAKTGYLALGSSQAVAFVKSRPEEEYADLQISFRPMTFNFDPSGRVEVDRYPAISASLYRVRPKSVGYMTLRSPDPLESPSFVPNYISDPEDVRATISGMRQIRKILATEPIASRLKGELAPGPQVQTDDQFLSYFETHGNSCYHPVGTCKMGRDPLGVVDERLRVRGVSGLRVVDASIMPRVTAGNTNAASIMIGEKGADLIREDAVARRL